MGLMAGRGASRPPAVVGTGQAWLERDIREREAATGRGGGTRGGRRETETETVKEKEKRLVDIKVRRELLALMNDDPAFLRHLFERPGNEHMLELLEK